MIRLRFKYFMPERNEFSTTGEEPLLSVSEYYGVKPRAEAFEADAAESRAESLEGYRKVYAGDFVMNYMLAWKGSYGVSDYDGIVSPAYAVYKIDPRYANGRFIHHRLRSEHMRSVFKARSKGIIESRLRLYPDTFLSMEIELPDLETQKTIADFLDRETAHIDQLIQKKQRLTELIGEKRSALLTGVISGIRHGGRPLARTHSQWFPQIPEDWQLARLKDVCIKITDGPHISPEYVDEGIPFISARNVKVDRWALGDAKFISKELFSELSKKSKPEVGDVLYTKGGTTGIARAVDLDFDFHIWVHIALIKLRRRLSNPFFIAYALNSSACYDQSQLYTRGATNNDLGLSRMVNIQFPLPPIDVQNAIVEYLDKKTRTLDAAKAKTLQSISHLTEFRTALITAAVTGQIDVATWGKRGETDRRLDRIEEELASPTNEQVGAQA